MFVHLAYLSSVITFMQCLASWFRQVPFPGTHIVLSAEGKQHLDYNLSLN